MSIDALPKRLGAPPQLDPRIMRMDSFQDENQHQPFFLEKGLFDMELDPFNFELDDLDLTDDYDENSAPTANVNAQVVSMSPSMRNVHMGGLATYPNQYLNYDWAMITQKRELSQIAPLPCTFDDEAPKNDDKEKQKRIPFAPCIAAHSNRGNAQRPSVTQRLPDPVVKEESVIKAEPLVCRLTISAQPFTPSDSSEMSFYSPSGAARKICLQAGCSNRARSHQRCKKHGGARQCTFDGCVKNSQSRGLCIAHGGGSRCRFEGCKRASQSRGLCKSHGGGKFCAVGGCKKKAHLKQLCRMHGGGERCKVIKCLKWAQKKGWCMAHAKEMEH
ncbi:hypothetical protein H310_00737 [Aphanomyces invadans]|uniref:WRKY19-like zinc finger domain-containing protein n=1 Tax=Aphanomyces invadans TaxID=157072 RepID=A0A024UWY4_9STRA|nr:hypothetical protein H310_00737 [Aphanomyces invadans]ETW10432.1 hypothetical protein H310_00737 [Aphanomyces invadans]|eukprot:XP_008861843.1 hypothetical protein H310_00737 [Aphanomyces invadans]